MNFLFGFRNRNETKSKVGASRHDVLIALGALLRSNLGFCNGGLCLGTPTPEAKPRLRGLVFKRFTSGTFFILFLLAFLLFPHTTFANGLQRAPSNLGLVGYWSFNEGTSTSVWDSSGNGNFLTVTNEATIETDHWTNGIMGNAFVFKTIINDYLFTPSISKLQSQSAVTYSAWVRRNSLLSAVTFGSQNPVGGSGGVRNVINLFTDGNIYFNSGNTATGSYGFAPLNDTNWHMVTMVFDGTQSTPSTILKGYIDGNPTSLTFGGDTLTNGAVTGSSFASGFIIGRNILNASFTRGKIDEVRVYNRALSASEVSSLYGTSVVTRKTVSNSGLVGYWPLDEGSGTTIYDVSGNKNDGSVFGSTGWSKGRRGDAFKFTGNTDWGSSTIKNTFNISTSPQTVNVWYKQVSGAQDIAAVTIRNNAGSGGYHLTVSGGGIGNISIGLWGGGYIFNPASSTTPFGKWGMLTFTYDGVSSYKMYDNGVSVSSPTGNPVVSVNADQMVFSGYDAGQTGGRFGGNDQIDDVRVYNRLLSADEVAALYRAGQQNLSKTQTGLVSSGLVGYWPFDGRYVNWATGKALDASGNGNDGAFVSLATSTAVTTGKVGQALKFDGASTQKIQVGSTFGLGTTNVTITGWAYRANAGQHGSFIKIGGNSDGYGIGITNGGSTGFEASGDLLTGLFESSRWIPTTQNFGIGWHQFALIVTISGSAEIFYDGASVYTEGPSPPVAPTTSTTQIGGYTSGVPSNRYWTGGLDEIRVYNRVLTSAEIRQLYNAGR